MNKTTWAGRLTAAALSFCLTGGIMLMPPTALAVGQLNPKCSIVPYGLIGMTWQKYWVGPDIGCAITNERDVLGRRGRIQDFERGQIAWSPDQAPKMTIWAIKKKNRVHVRWNTNDRYSYDFYIIRWDKDGQNVGQKDISGNTEGWWDFQFNQFGWYNFIAEGCDTSIFGSKCRHGWTIPVSVAVANADIPPPTPRPTPTPRPPTGTISSRPIIDSQLQFTTSASANSRKLVIYGNGFKAKDSIRVSMTTPVNGKPRATSSIPATADIFGHFQTETEVFCTELAITVMGIKAHGKESGDSNTTGQSC